MTIAHIVQVVTGEQKIMIHHNGNTTPVLVVEDLTKIYGKEFTILGKKFGRKVTGANKVSFTVEKGEIFGFLGPNGAGKTTTIRSILGYLNIKSGIVLINNMDHRINSIEIRRHIAYVPGDVSLYGNFSGIELIRFFGKFRKIDEKYLETLRNNFRVDLSLKIKSLSKGNRQQVALIAALASRPEFLILDEPSIGLDPLMVQKFHKILKSLRQEGTTIFLSSHDLTEVQQICDRIGIIKEGKMVVIEKVEDLRSKSLQNVTLDFGSNGNPHPSLKQLLNLHSVITAEQINGHSFSLKIKEDVNELIQLLAGYKVKRLTIENSSLQDIFLQFYN